MQLATWIGWRLQGVRGGLIAGGLFVLPGALVVLVLSMIYAAYGTLPLVAALFAGVQAAVVAIVLEALIRVSKRALKTRVAYVIAGLAFAALFFFNIPFPLVIVAAATYGYFATSSPTSDSTVVPSAGYGIGQALRTASLWTAIWLVPLGILILSGNTILADIGTYFAKLAVLTFGGAYAVLAWMAQEVVEDKGWLTLAQMMDGLGLAETTPGPLILVTEFVGYMAAHREGGPMLGLAAAAVTLWVTFIPSFGFIFTGAPFIARLTTMPRLSGALAAITAAVVGVIANLSLWFALHVVFDRIDTVTAGPLRLFVPDVTSLDLTALVIGIVAGVLLLIRHWNILAVLGLSALASATVAALS
jgi:chromate transporter